MRWRDCQLGANVTGLDASDENIKVAKAYAAKHELEIKYIQGSAEAHEGLYDVVLALEIIEHVNDPEFFIKAAAKLVKPGGMMILSTINRTHKAYLMTIAAAEYILGWVPKGTHDYNKFVKPSEIAKLAGAAGLSLKELKGLGYNIWTKSWKLQDDVDVNYFAYLSK